MIKNGAAYKAICLCLTGLLSTAFCGSGSAYAAMREVSSPDDSHQGAPEYVAAYDGAGIIGSACQILAAAQERVSDPLDLGYIPGEMVVVYEEGATEAEREDAIDIVDGVSSSEQAEFEMGAVATVEISGQLTVEEAVEAVEADPAVKYAIPNYIASLSEVPNGRSLATADGNKDEYQNQQWHLDYVKAPAAWELLANTASANRTKVAVIDTGASLTHPDLRNRVNKSQSIEVVWSNENDSSSWGKIPLRGDGYTNGGSEINEKSGHGTHVSGIIAAEAGNGGVVGVASGADTARANNLVDLVVIDAFSLLRRQQDGSLQAGAELNDIVFALRYARDCGCAVVNMSLGFSASDSKLVKMFNELTTELTEKNNMLIVAAAGNDGVNVASVPAVCDNVMGVISVSDISVDHVSSETKENYRWLSGTTTRSYFSNYGTWCDISAPGESILSTLFYEGTQDAYGFMSGTSMASPVVAGVAAMVRSANPALSAKQVRSVLCDTAVDLGQPVEAACGLVDAQAAVSAAINYPPSGGKEPSSTVAPKPQPSISTGGWKQSGGKWWYQYRGGGYPSSCWQQIGGKWYHFDAAGYMQTGWLKVGGTWYFLNSGGDMATGWKKYGGSWYYLGSNGAMATGWKKIGGAWYYLNRSGAMATGWLRQGATWYYLNGSGAMATGWKKVGGAWYYFVSSGAMATGWRSVGNVWYFFDRSGAMASNRWIGNYYVTGSGAMATDTWIGRYHVGKTGRWDLTR